MKVLDFADRQHDAQAAAVEEKSQDHLQTHHLRELQSTAVSLDMEEERVPVNGMTDHRMVLARADEKLSGSVGMLSHRDR